MIGTRGVQRSLELFLQYPFNNVLHRHVATLVVAVGRGSPALAEFLVHQCRLLTWLVEAPVEVRLRACLPACLPACVPVWPAGVAARAWHVQTVHVAAILALCGCTQPAGLPAPVCALSHCQPQPHE